MDPLAPVYRFELPWSIDSLGPGVAPEILPRIAEEVAAAVRKGGFFASGDPVPWIKSRDDVERLLREIMAGLRDARGHTLQEFLAAAHPVWELQEGGEVADDVVDWVVREHGKRRPRTELTIWPLVVRFDNLRRALEPYRDLSPKDVLRDEIRASFVLANKVALGAIDRALAEVFTSGCILVFEQEGSGWRLVPLSDWERRHPFDWFNLSNLKHDDIVRAEAFSPEEAAHSALYIFERSEEARTGIFRDPFVSADPLWWFIRADTLPSELLLFEGVPSNGASRGKRGPGRPLGSGYQDMDAPLIKKGIVLLVEKKAGKPTEAATIIYNADPNLVAGGGTRISKIRRLARKIAAGWEKNTG